MTNYDIDKLFVALYGREATPRERKHCLDWFAGLPVVAAADADRALSPATTDDVGDFKGEFRLSGRNLDDSTRAGLDAVLSARRAMLGAAPAPAPVADPPKPVEPLLVGLPLVTDGDYDAFVEARGWMYDKEIARLPDKAGIEAVLKRRAVAMRAARPDLFDGHGRLLPQAEAETGGGAAPEPETRASAPDPLAEPTKREVSAYFDRYCECPAGQLESHRVALAGFVADRRQAMAASRPSAPEPPPRPSVYAAYTDRGIVIREKSNGPHNPVIATLDAGEILRLAERAAKGDAS